MALLGLVIKLELALSIFVVGSGFAPTISNINLQIMHGPQPRSPKHRSRFLGHGIFVKNYAYRLTVLLYSNFARQIESLPFFLPEMSNRAYKLLIVWFVYAQQDPMRDNE